MPELPKTLADFGGSRHPPPQSGRLLCKRRPYTARRICSLARLGKNEFWMLTCLPLVIALNRLTVRLRLPRAMHAGSHLVSDEIDERNTVHQEARGFCPKFPRLMPIASDY
ncbi:hypothetical protein BS17DRAFT_300790 [Gyrodon lividus]|nr:hypothetical protein BS17DRAFT_300790 [Gyrodon lividus]